MHVLLVVFGTLVAASLPMVLALTAFFAANGPLAVISHAMHVDRSASSVMLLMGLAVGVDYCLFYLRREREERAAGRDRDAALRIAAATSGRSEHIMAAFPGGPAPALVVVKAPGHPVSADPASHRRLPAGGPAQR